MGGVAQQVGRIGNSLANAFGGGVKVKDSGAYDMWGNEWDDATVKHWYGNLTDQKDQNAVPGWAKERLAKMGNQFPMGTPNQLQVGAPNAPALPIANDIAAGKEAPLALSAEARAAWKPTATVAALTNTATPDAASTIDANARNRQGLWQAFYDKTNSEANPYGEKGLAARLAMRDGQVNKQFANAERQTMEDMAARGMIGSGQEVGAQNVLRAERAAALDNAHNQTTTDYQQLMTQFEQNKAGRLSQLLSGDYTGADSSLERAAKLPGELRDQSIVSDLRTKEFGLDTRRVDLAEQQMKQLIAQGDQTAAWNIGKGLLEASGRVLSDPKVQQFLYDWTQKLMSGGAGGSSGGGYTGDAGGSGMA